MRVLTPRAAYAAVTFAFVLAVPTRPAAADNEPLMTGRAVTTISPAGEVSVDSEIDMKSATYQMLKSTGVSAFALAKSINMNGQNWALLEDLEARYDDAETDVEIAFRTPGAVRTATRGRWIYQLPESGNYQIAHESAEKVVLVQITSNEMGFGTLIMDVVPPEGASDVAFDPRTNRLTYYYEPEVEVAGDTRIDLDVDAKDLLMSCLAKSYGDRDFANMWAARSIARNRGETLVEDFRIRFRVSGIGAWSGWKRSPRVYPGQTVVDPFFPIFDLDKVMSMTGSRPVMLEVEYRYEADGERVEETDSYPVKLLGPNEVIFCSQDYGDCEGFYDYFDNAPTLMAAFTTPGDPVIQQLAGRLSGVAAELNGGPVAANTSDEDCLLYLRAAWEFITRNKIAYQTPPGVLSEGKFGQHIKFGRDVLRNRAGTCVDFAVTWASLCEAVGLEPVVVVLPGHAFPAVTLPGSGNLLAIESTMVGATFDQAVKRGMAELGELEGKPHFRVAIKTKRREGVVPLDLPNVSASFLEDLDYDTKLAGLTAPSGGGVGGATGGSSGGRFSVLPTIATDDFVPNGAGISNAKLVAHWGGQAIIEGPKLLSVIIFLESNGDCLVRYVVESEDGSQNSEDGKGVWSKRGDELRLDIEGKDYYWDYPLRMQDGTLYVYEPDFDVVVPMKVLND